MSIIPTPNFGYNFTAPIAPSQLPPEVKKKKKKRSREHDLETDDEGEGSKEERRRKRKRRQQEQDNIAEPSAVASTPDQPIDALPAKKKKSKKRNKGKQAEVVQPTQLDQQIDPGLDEGVQTAAAALISAIVAAAAGTSDTLEHVPEPPEPQFSQMSHPDQHLMHYPFMPYGYGAPSYVPQNAMQPAMSFPTSTNLPFSELTFGSNDDVLRALQALDMSKITNVLRTLGEAAAAANGPPLSQSSPTPLGQVPAASGAIMGFPPEQSAPVGHRRTLDMPMPGSEHANPDHAYILANKWLNANKLSELVRSEGLVYKKGKFSAIEEQQLKAAINDYQTLKGLSDDHMLEIIFPKVDKTRDNAFWSDITTAVPQRPIIAVYHHVRRSYHPMKQQGKWMPREDAALKEAVTDLGQQWEKVSQRVGRMSSDCRDRYRNHIAHKEVRVTGTWTKEEEDELTRIVTDMTVKQGKDIDNDVFWGRVSELMGSKRGRQQCRIKWTDALSKTFKNEGHKPRWSQQDAYILVHKVDSLNVRDDTEIDWKTISDPQWNLWSAHTLQRRWLTLKRSVKGYEDMTHQDIMDILRVKKAQLPAPPVPSAAKKRKERKVTSAAAIEDQDVPEAGSSHGPGTGKSKAVVESSDDSTSDSD